MFFLLVACTTDNLPEVLDGVDAAASDIDTLVADHVAAVSAATTTDEVATAESDYAAAWPGKQSALADALDMASQCAMDDTDSTALDGCMTAMDAMDAAITAHTAAGCTTLDDCTAAETTHEAEMTGYTDTLRAAGTGWNDGTMECSMGDMGGM